MKFINRLNLDRRTQVIAALVEGNSIHSTERMTGIHRDTIMRLLVEAGANCAAIMDEKMRDLPCKRVQVDQIWSYVGKKQRRVRTTDDRFSVGDQWTFVAIDADKKLIPTWLVGKRSTENAHAFMHDLSMRLINRVQLSSDAMDSYENAVEEAFGVDVDYGQAVKFDEAEPVGPVAAARLRWSMNAPLSRLGRSGELPPYVDQSVGSFYGSSLRQNDDAVALSLIDLIDEVPSVAA